MRIYRRLVGALALVFCSISVASELAMPADSPFRVYSVADGLNQKAVQAVVQDSQGFLWVATYGGLNRFDGLNFKSFTTRHGLRQNFVTALYLDQSDRLWVGDAEGGITLIEHGEVVLVIDPPEGHHGTLRSMVELDGMLYMGAEPGSLRRLSMTAPQLGIEYLTEMPTQIDQMVSVSDSELLILSDDRLYRYQPSVDAVPRELDGEITGLAGSKLLGIYVGNRLGQVGRWNNGETTWFPERYGQPVTGLSFSNSSPRWVHTKNFYMPLGQPAKKVEVFDPIGALVDAEGVLWLAQPSGLARFLGMNFMHYSLALEGSSPSVYSIHPDSRNGFWFGTDEGLMRLDAEGELLSMADFLNMPTSEVRDLRLASDQRTLWVSHINGRVYRVDTRALTAEAVFPDEDAVLVSLELDEKGRVWAGSYEGSLYVYDPRTKQTSAIDFGKGASVYSQSMGSDGWLWFSVNYAGIYRLNTRETGAQPELVVSADEIGRTLFTHITVVETSTGRSEVWFSTINGGVFCWTNGALSRVIDHPSLSDQTVYSVAPLDDRTLVIATNRGAYRYDLDKDLLQHYGPLNGFLGVEGKTHAIYLEDDKTLWIGTGSGVTRMDISRPMSPIPSPRTFITMLNVDDSPLMPASSTLAEVAGSKIVIEYAAVSTRAPDRLEYSHILSGFDDSWSSATASNSIGYSHLPPGTYEFQVRARRAGGRWGAPDNWSFVIPTPFWQTYWFVGLTTIFGLLLVRGLVQLRLRSIANANRRLREEVLDRTKSIERGKNELEKINSQLSDEIEERKRSDMLRADVEARFHQAYQNSPLGMALVNREGLVYDANPILKDLFWPDSAEDDKEPLLPVIAPHDRGRFEEFLKGFSAGTLDTPSMQVECIAHYGETRQIDFLPSAVRNDTNEMMYIVLLANDVTESCAMTRQLEYQASYDELTGLLNRRVYTERLQGAATRQAHDTYLLLLDLDQFKVVNDTCGHAAGDELLRTTAHTILSAVTETDTVARVGGDEFAVILTNCDQAAALDRAENIRRSIQDLEFFWESEVFRIGASIGVVAVDGSRKNLVELQQLADAACYAAKDSGRNRVHLVSSDQDAAYEHRGEMRWVQRLKQAIDTNGFVLFGQRIQSLHSARDEGSDNQEPFERIEVLIRMRDRQANRLIPPGAFLPIAERYALHDKLDLWVVSEVIELILSQKPSEMSKRQFWVNLSGASLSDKKFCSELIFLVADASVPRGSLNFEITETAVIRKIDGAAKLVEALRNMGCKFALDDFGSGLSSFGYLKKLKVEYLKVDGEFIRDITTDPTDHIFVKSIIDIAHAMGMQVVTEFVEDDEVLQRVAELGADYAQGFGVHRPEPLEAMVKSVIPTAKVKG